MRKLLLVVPFVFFFSVAGAQEVDTDGDGLNDAAEVAVYNTNPLKVDTDDDGMSDLYEVRYSLDPRDAGDAGDDPDLDLFTNAEEFRADADPRDSQSPVRSYFVSPEGNDASGDGSRSAPWQTIRAAVDALEKLYPHNTANDKINLVLAAGEYETDVQLFPGLGIAGASRPESVVVGRIDLEAGSLLYNLTVREPKVAKGELPSARLVRMDAGPVTVRGVDFLGDTPHAATGIRVEGDEQTINFIIDCSFIDLREGIDVRGSLPRVTRCVFDKIKENGIVFRQRVTPGASDANSFGDVSDPYSGFNVFKEVGGFAAFNERGETIRMQNNDWGISDPELIPRLVSGNAVVPPILAPAGSVLAGSMFATVWDARSRARITNARLSLQVSAFADVRENLDGVYAYPALSDGRYTITATSPGYAQKAQVVDIDGGQIVSALFALQPVTTGEGEGEGETPTLAEAIATLGDSFDTADVDGNGGLSFEEAEAALAGLTQELFDAIDTNQDGELSAAELGIGVGGCNCQGAKSLIDDPAAAAGDILIHMLALLSLVVISRMRVLS